LGGKGNAKGPVFWGGEEGGGQRGKRRLVRREGKEEGSRKREAGRGKREEGPRKQEEGIQEAESRKQEAWVAGGGIRRNGKRGKGEQCR
jgi:hypothetical protein